jgi:hypothetical protein
VYGPIDAPSPVKKCFTDLHFLGFSTKILACVHKSDRLLGGASAWLALKPSFKLSIEAEPAIRYVHALGPLDTYNGLTRA